MKSIGFAICTGTFLLLAGFLHPAPVLAGGGPDEMSAGLAWLDCDGDGDLDILYLTETGAVVLLAYNPGTDRFADISETALPSEIRNLAMAPQGVVCGDVNNDGFEDFFLTMEGENFLAVNDGTGSFRATSRASGVGGGMALSASAAMFDYNNDGLLDIYVTNYMAMPNNLYRNDGVDEQGVPHFTDVASELGVALAANGQSNWSLGVAVADYDNDGDVDLYVANDYNGIDEFGGLRPGENVLYRNEGDGTFTDVSWEAGAAEPGWAMGVDFGDYDGDGWLDIFLSNFWEDALLRNNQDGTFSNVTREAGLITDLPGEWHYNGWGTSFIDFDNDGDLDIHVSNGWILNDRGQILNEPNQLWENVGKGEGGFVQFVDISRKAGVADMGNARGAAYGDFNRDGLVDFIVANNEWLASPEIEEAPYRMLYVNRGDGTFEDLGLAYGLRDKFPDRPKPTGYRDYTGNAWIQVRLEGRASNRSGIGSRVTVTAGGRTQIEDLGACSYASQNSPYLHFGLGSAASVDELAVRFPSGRTMVLRNLAPNQIFTITEPEWTPVRLLSFDATSSADGVLVVWTYADLGDLSGFELIRHGDGTRTTVASPLHAGDRIEVLDPAPAPGERVRYELIAVHRDGSRESLGFRTHRHEPSIALRLGQSLPNPFTAGTGIPVLSGRPGPVRIGIFDVSGRRVRTLERTVSPGRSVLEWDGLDGRGMPAPAGTYFYRILGGTGIDVRKMVKASPGR